MKITTQGKGIRIGQRLETKIADKMSKFDKYFGEEGTFNVRIRPEGDRMVVEITLKLDNRIYRAEARDEEILTAVDRTIDKLESQIRKQKTKFLKQKKEYPQIVSYLEDEADSDFDFEDEEDEKKIIKRKTFELRPMSSEDAILQMEMLGHNFLVYLDADTNVVSVIYKRKDGNYGLIEPAY
ncbi:MAG: ribosome-associated translation inhibitor RaiA [Clostridiales bacterium]|nr:ribosome-associated translation inhibitor RaiA [Clostridiales bacterium]